MKPFLQSITFGHIPLDPRQIFLLRPTVFATVNLKPYSPGHVLVCPRRIVPKFQDLTPEQASDLFITAQEVAKKLEMIYEREVHLTIQNGEMAGQTVRHTHMHVVPGTGGVERGFQLARGIKEMGEEAEMYRKYFEEEMGEEGKGEGM